MKKINEKEKMFMERMIFCGDSYKDWEDSDYGGLEIEKRNLYCVFCQEIVGIDNYHKNETWQRCFQHSCQGVKKAFEGEILDFEEKMDFLDEHEGIVLGKEGEEHVLSCFCRKKQSEKNREVKIKKTPEKIHKLYAHKAVTPVWHLKCSECQKIILVNLEWFAKVPIKELKEEYEKNKREYLD